MCSYTKKKHGVVTPCNNREQIADSVVQRIIYYYATLKSLLILTKKYLV